MPCQEATQHHYSWQKLDVGWRLVCDYCGHVADAIPVPSQAELLEENKRLKETIREQERLLETHGLSIAVGEWDDRQ